MNQTPHTHDAPQLDSFDQALLRELRVVASERPPAPVRSRRKRWAIATGGLAAASVTAFGLTSMGPAAAAYAVERTDAGDITITIHQLDDSEGLEKALADYGIDADVDYDAVGSAAPGGVTPEDLTRVIPEGEVGEQGSLSGSARVEGAEPGDQSTSACGEVGVPPMQTGVRGDDYVITIPQDSPILAADAVLQITTSGSVDESFTGVSVDYTVDGNRCGFGSAQAGAIPAA